MKIASAIVTDHGRRTCHAAIVARDLNVSAVVGAAIATTALRNGSSVTICCAGGETGMVYNRNVWFEVTSTDIGALTLSKTEIMVTLATRS